jgi:hypothetical protein
MRLRVMPLAASVLATVAVSTVSHVNGPFRSEDAEPVTHGKSEIWPSYLLWNSAVCCVLHWNFAVSCVEWPP